MKPSITVMMHLARENQVGLNTVDRLVERPDEEATTMAAPGTIHLDIADLYVAEGQTMRNRPVPLRPGWLIAYREPRKPLLDGTVLRVEPGRAGWLIHLTNGFTVQSRHVKSVGKVEHGRVVSAWLVRSFGLDGQRDDVGVQIDHPQSDGEARKPGSNSTRAPPTGEPEGARSADQNPHITI